MRFFHVLLLSLLWVTLFLLAACNNSDDDGTPEPDPGDSTSCDSTYTDLDYAQDIRPILVENCVSCHSGNTPAAGINLSTYSSITAYENANPGVLYNSVAWLGNASQMPQNGEQLPACEVEQIRVWIAEGMPGEDVQDTTACDTTNITYTEHIQPILAASCTGCHGGSDPDADIDLSSYELVVQYEQANPQKLYSSVAWQQDPPVFARPMPQGQGTLPDCEIEQIRVWVANGMPE